MTNLTPKHKPSASFSSSVVQMSGVAKSPSKAPPAINAPSPIKASAKPPPKAPSKAQSSSGATADRGNIGRPKAPPPQSSSAAAASSGEEPDDRSRSPPVTKVVSPSKIGVKQMVAMFEEAKKRGGLSDADYKTYLNLHDEWMSAIGDKDTKASKVKELQNLFKRTLWKK